MSKKAAHNTERSRRLLAGASVAAMAALFLAALRANAQTSPTFGGFKGSISYTNITAGSLGGNPPVAANQVSVALGYFLHPKTSGILDLAVADAANATLEVWSGNGDGTFQRPAGGQIYTLPNLTTLYPSGAPEPAVITTTGNTQIAAADLVSDTGASGYEDVVLANFVTPGTVVIFRNQRSGDGFSAAYLIPSEGIVSNEPYYSLGGSATVAIGDFNGDGLPDLAVGLSAPTNGSTIDVVLNNCNGGGAFSFCAPVPYNAGYQLVAVAVAPLRASNTEEQDIVATDGANVYVLLNHLTDDGTFPCAASSTPTCQEIDGFAASSLIAANLNDGSAPGVFVVDDYGDAAVLLNNGSGVLSVQAGSSFPINYAATAGLFGASGSASTYPGLVLLASPGMLFYPNTTSTPGGSVSFGPSELIGPFTSQYGIGAALATGDINGKGNADVVAAAGNQLHIVLGNGNGTFQTTPSYLESAADPSETTSNASTQIVAVAVGNLHGTTNGAMDTVSVDVGQADTDFPNATCSLIVRLANANGTLQTGTAIFSAPETTAQFNSIALGDFGGAGFQTGGSGAMDIAALTTTGDIYIFQNQGNGTFSSTPVVVPTGFSSLSGLVAGDFNDHGAPWDLAAIGPVVNAYNYFGVPQSGSVLVFLGNGDGTFASGVQYQGTPNTSASSLTTFVNPAQLAVGSLGSSSYPDIVVADSGEVYASPAGGGVWVLRNKGDGTFNDPVQVSATSAQCCGGLTAGPSSIGLGHFFGTAYLDIAAATVPSASVPSLEVLQNAGTYTFPIPSTSTYIYPYGGEVAIADVNHDNAPDVLLFSGDAVQVFLNTTGYPAAFASSGILLPWDPSYTTGPSSITAGTNGLPPLFAVGYSANSPTVPNVAAGDAQPAVDLLLNGANGTGTGATLVSIAVTPPNPSILVGATEQFAATGTYSDNSTQDLTDSVTWSSSTMSVATISATGLATGAGAGPTTIGATYNGISGQTTLAVYPAIVIEPASLPGGTAGVAYSQALTATGGSGAGYTWSITAGASSLSGLGLSLSGNTILGSDPTAGTANFTVQVTDSLNFTATMSYTLTIGAALSPANVSDEETISVSDSEVVNTFTLPAPIAVDAPVAYFSTGTPLGFGGQSGNQQTIAVSNIGEASMTLASVALSSGAPFSLSAPTCFNGASSSSTPVTLPSSAFCTVTITYSGSAPTTDTGTLTFTDNAALSNLTSTASGSNYTQSITLNGEGGVTPPPAAPPATEPVTDDETITVTDEVSVIAGYTIGGTLSGLASGGSVMLLDNGGDALTLSKNGAFAFATPLASAAGYDVTVGTQPAGQVCTVSKGTGAVASANITSVSVSCITTTATLSLTAQPASATVNGSVTLTATVTPTAAGPNTPSGIVDFMLRGVSLQNCSAVHVNTSGIATCTTNALPAGEDTITASYADDPNFTVNTPGMVTVNVAAAPATMTLNASPAISALGGSVTLTALVTPGVTGPVTPSGNVNFTLNGASLTGCSSIAVNSASDTAMCTTTTLPAGSDTITATYSSDPNFTVSAPASTTVQVGPANTTTTLTTSGTLGAEGYNLTLTATVTSAAAGTITGVVTFYNGTAELGSMQLQHGSPTVAFSTDTLPEGSNTLTAVYSGDNDFLGSTSAAVDQTISGFNLSFSSNGSITLLPGQTITLTVTVTPVYGAYANPIAFSITGLPSGATYTFSPGSAMPGSNAVTTTLTITIPPASSQSQAPVTFRDAGPALLAILMPAAAFYRKRRRLRSILLALTAVCALGTLSTLSGCGTSGFFNQPPKTYTITVTGSSGAAQHSTTLTVTVE